MVSGLRGRDSFLSVRYPTLEAGEGGGFSAPPDGPCSLAPRRYLVPLVQAQIKKEGPRFPGAPLIYVSFCIRSASEP
jgi:hypothetical protein